MQLRIAHVNEHSCEILVLFAYESILDLNVHAQIHVSSPDLPFLYIKAARTDKTASEPSINAKFSRTTH